MLLHMQAIAPRRDSLLPEQVPESPRIANVSDSLSLSGLSGENPLVTDYPNCSTLSGKLNVNPQGGSTSHNKEAFAKARDDAMLRYKEKKKHRQ